MNLNSNIEQIHDKILEEYECTQFQKVSVDFVVCGVPDIFVCVSMDDAYTMKCRIQSNLYKGVYSRGVSMSKMNSDKTVATCNMFRCTPYEMWLLTNIVIMIHRFVVPKNIESLRNDIVNTAIGIVTIAIKYKELNFTPSSRYLYG